MERFPPIWQVSGVQRHIDDAPRLDEVLITELRYKCRLLARALSKCLQTTLWPHEDEVISDLYRKRLGTGFWLRHVLSSLLLG
jgi:hypothetical protein